MPFKPFLRPLLAFIAGGLLPLAFAPLQYWLLAVLSPTLLLAIWHQQSPLRASWLGWLYGLGTFTIGVSWVFISIYEYGHTTFLIALILTALFIMLLAGFFALQGYLLQRYFSRHNHYVRNCIAFPSLWVILEALRCWLLTGFPWLLLCYSQVTSPLRGYAPILGGFAVSFLAALSSGLLYSVWQTRSTQYYKPLLALFCIWIVGIPLNHYHWTSPQSNSLKVSLIQGNIPQALKWTPQQIEPTLKSYAKLTQAHWDSALIIWPEAAIPLLQNLAQDFLAAIDQAAKQHHTTVLLGIPAQAQNRYYNALITLGDGQGVYYKRHLVPFGEYLPFNWLRSIINFFAIPMPDFSPGPLKQANLVAGGINIAPFICYEVAYSQLARRQLPAANLLVTVSNDAWFGHSFAAYQHLQIAQLRSLESGRYSLMSTNTGITAVITPQGQLQTIAPDFQTTVLTSRIVAMQGNTPWIIWGDWPILIATLTSLVILVAWRKR